MQVTGAHVCTTILTLRNVGLVVPSATAEQGVMCSIPGSGKVLLVFSIRNFSVAITDSGYVKTELIIFMYLTKYNQVDTYSLEHGPTAGPIINKKKKEVGWKRDVNGYQPKKSK